MGSRFSCQVHGGSLLRSETCHESTRWESSCDGNQTGSRCGGGDRRAFRSARSGVARVFRRRLLLGLAGKSAGLGAGAIGRGCRRGQGSDRRGLADVSREFTIDGRGGNDQLFGDEGNDTITGGAHGSAGDTVDYSAAGEGVTVDLSNGAAQTVSAGQGDDTISGTAQSDVISTLNGNDTITALAGNDIICAGRGNDKIGRAHV